MTTATSVGNLTTIFVPAPSCLTDVYGYNASYIYIEDSQIKTFQYTVLGPTSTSACVPSGFVPASAYYSPGICPSSYTQACSSVIASGSTTETHATCCPMSVVEPSLGLYSAADPAIVTTPAKPKPQTHGHGIAPKHAQSPSSLLVPKPSTSPPPSRPAQLQLTRRP